ncbi:MAG: FtsX-like permease family protein [Bacteroidales bacterium]|nr:FtsX-like permease family protein [Bacteroidales bacterium]
MALLKSYPASAGFSSTLEQKFDALYSTEVRTGKLFGYFSVLAIFISCLGLLGISVFAAEQRTKEIGIRKVVGASSNNIVKMLNREFVKLVAIAYVISCPVAYYFTQNWLQNFVFRTELSWWIFAVAGAFVLIITLLTVSWQSYIAARRNPVDSLRYE